MFKALTIFHIITGLGNGGAEGVLYRLCTKDKKYRHIDFLLLSIDFYNNFSERYSDSNFIKVDLLTNFYSFGEMPKKFFSNYLNSNIMRNSQNLYFCNRYDSSPFYEPTYQESYSILDYLIDGFKIELNRSSGIHSYMNPVRKVNNIIRARPISSSYFDLIQSKKFKDNYP